MTKVLNTLLTLLMALFAVSCSNRDIAVLESPELIYDYYAVTDNAVLSADKKGVFSLHENQCKAVTIARIRQKGLTVAVVKSTDDTTAPHFLKNLPTLWEHSLSMSKEVCYTNDTFSLQFPADSICGMDCDQLFQAKLTGWGPVSSFSGNMLPGGELLDNSTNQLLFSANTQIVVEKKGEKKSEVHELALKKGTPVKMRFRLPATVSDSVLPMWHFDETNCVWTQTAFAERHGDSYYALVDQLGWWVCYKPIEPLKQISVQLQDLDGLPIGNADLLLRSTSRNKEQHLCTAADGSCTFSVPQHTDYQLYYCGLDLLNTGCEDLEYIHVPHPDSLLLDNKTPIISEGEVRTIHLSTDNLRETLKVHSGVVAVKAADYNRICKSKLLENGTRPKAKRQKGNDPIKKSASHTGCVEIRPENTKLIEAANSCGNKLPIWEKVSDYTITTENKGHFEFNPILDDGRINITFIVDGVKYVDVDTTFDKKHRPLFYSIKKLHVVPNTSLFYSIRYMCDGKPKTGCFGIEPIDWKETPLETVNLEIKNKNSFGETILISKSPSKISGNLPIKINASVGHKNLNIIAIKDDYNRNVISDVRRDYLNPIALKSQHLTFEFAGYDSIFNSTIAISPLDYDVIYKSKTDDYKKYIPILLLIIVTVALLKATIFAGKEKLTKEDVSQPIAAVLLLSPKLSERQLELLSQNKLREVYFDIELIKNYLSTRPLSSTLYTGLPKIAKLMPYADRREFVNLLFKLAVEDDGIQDAEWERVTYIMQELAMTDETIYYMHRRYEPLRVHNQYHQQSSYNTDYKQQNKKVNSVTQTDYELLGVREDATKNEIRSAYRKLAKEYHPDLPKNASRHRECVLKMAALNTAYDRLMSK